MVNGELYFGAYASVTLSGKSYGTTATNITFADGTLTLFYKSRFSDKMLRFDFKNVVHTVKEVHSDSKSSVVTSYLEAGTWKSKMAGEINKTRTWYRVHTFEIRGLKINGSEGACYAWITERREQTWRVYTSKLNLRHLPWEKYTVDGSSGTHAGRYVMERYLSEDDIKELEKENYEIPPGVMTNIRKSPYLGIEFSSNSYRVDSAEVSPSLLLYMRVAMAAEDPSEDASTVEFA